MDLTQLDLNDVITEVRRAADLHPDKVMSQGGCLYFTGDGEPSCIIGHAIHALGATLEDVGGSNNSLTCNVIFGFGDSPESSTFWVPSVRYPPTMNWLYKVQALQDMQFSWAEAVRRADQAYPLTQGD
jgi:hypothetical protein